jgi:hypothetical protein
VTSETVSSPGGPVTVLVADYGMRTDGLPVSISATVDGTADFVNYYEYDDEGRLVDLVQTGQGGSAVADKHVAFEYNEDGQFVAITRYASLDTSELVVVAEYTYGN